MKIIWNAFALFGLWVLYLIVKVALENNYIRYLIFK